MRFIEVYQDAGVNSLGNSHGVDRIDLLANRVGMGESDILSDDSLGHLEKIMAGLTLRKKGRNHVLLN